MIGSIKPTTLRGHYTRQNTSAIALLNLRLGSITHRGDPFKSVSNTLSGWFTHESEGREFLEYEMALGIKPESIKSLEKHRSAMAGFIRQCRQCVDHSLIHNARVLI